MNNKIIILFLLYSGLSHPDCFESVGQAYNISPLLLRSIAWNESKNQRNIISKKNSDGTYDIGIMQINSSHLNLLKKFNITENDLLYDSCINITVAGFILASNIKSRGNTWDAVGAYNAGYYNTPEAENRRKLYAEKIYNTYEKLQGQLPPKN